jgi:hypothetical protein
MRPDLRFLGQSKAFWACVRTISQWIGYTVKGKGTIRVYSVQEIQQAFRDLELNAEEIIAANGIATPLGEKLHLYFVHRAEVLNNYVKPRLMNLARATETFQTISNARPHNCPIPMNKQKGEKKAPAFLTGITNMLIEENLDGLPCNFDPRILTTVTRHGVPLRTLSRRVDGAFPDAINPIAIWEIKEYYYTTTFGSRVADGVYETLLDGMELEELAANEKIHVKHYIILDDYFTWWDCGRSYLCRIIDLLHMGYVCEALFGNEVVEEMPRIVKNWVALHEKRAKAAIPEPKIS